MKHWLAEVELISTRIERSREFESSIVSRISHFVFFLPSGKYIHPLPRQKDLSLFFRRRTFRSEIQTKDLMLPLILERECFNTTTPNHIQKRRVGVEFARSGRTIGNDECTKSVLYPRISNLKALRVGYVFPDGRCVRIVMSPGARFITLPWSCIGYANFPCPLSPLCLLETFCRRTSVTNDTGIVRQGLATVPVNSFLSQCEHAFSNFLASPLSEIT